MKFQLKKKKKKKTNSNFKATSDSAKEAAMGRGPREMCRPTTTTRGGFMEAQGAGIQLLMSADTALRMGCPIYAVIALTSTATDKEGRSVPAPGQGILTTARERRLNSGKIPASLSLQYRSQQLQRELEEVERWESRERRRIEEEYEEEWREEGEEDEQQQQLSHH